MDEQPSRGRVWAGTRTGKAVLVGGIATTVVVAIVILPLSIAGILAFLDSNKLRAQEGDRVDFVYTGMYDSNGTVFDSSTLYDQVIGSNSLLVSFDQQLVGMEPGVEKAFVIPAADGYPSGPFAGYDLRFEVTITRLVRGGTVMYP
ncbi:MAG: FKBP-type peptidyl-prolyl cis-trans isomerase [Candidatus Lokiarchaeota archaeon]|nr:FKBP-type peptidyl-prolyl cis-trans isomerase [Candidatus Lokiarchaeota archaeon]